MFCLYIILPSTGAVSAADAADVGDAAAARGPAARTGHPINWGVFGASAIIIAIVAAGAIISPSTVQSAFGAAVAWAGKWFGSFYIILITAALVFVVLVAVTKYGLVKLGPDNSTPDFSTFSWAAMLFAAGIGTFFYKAVGIFRPRKKFPKTCKSETVVYALP